MSIRSLFGLFLLLPLLALAASPARAGDDDVAAVKRRIEGLQHEAEMLKAEGRHDAADVLFKRARELGERLARRAHATEPKPLTFEQAERVLHGLEMGMESLKVLGHEKDLKALAKIADEVRRRLRQARQARQARAEHPEIREAKRQLEIFRLAFHGLREGEKREAMDRMEHAIHVMELNLEGRRDEEAQEIRRRGPDRGEKIELLQLAAKLWDGFGHETKAKTIRELAEQLAAGGRRASDRRATGPRARDQHEREVLRRRLDVLRLAHVAMREAEKEHLVEQVDRAIHALEIAISGREDDEARAISRKAPNKEQIAELLGYAAHLYAEWGNEERARQCKQLSLELLGKGPDEPSKGGRGGFGQEIHEQRLRLWRYALAAFREAEKRALVERTELLVHAHELALAGREDDEARETRRRAPKTEQQAELAAAASHLYAGWGKEDRAHALMALAHELATSEAARREEAETPPDRDDARAEQQERFEILQAQVHEVRMLFERLQAEVQELRHRLDED